MLKLDVQARSEPVVPEVTKVEATKEADILNEEEREKQKPKE